MKGRWYGQPPFGDWALDAEQVSKWPASLFERTSMIWPQVSIRAHSLFIHNRSYVPFPGVDWSAMLVVLVQHRIEFLNYQDRGTVTITVQPTDRCGRRNLACVLDHTRKSANPNDVEARPDAGISSWGLGREDEMAVRNPVIILAHADVDLFNEKPFQGTSAGHMDFLPFEIFERNIEPLEE